MAPEPLMSLTQVRNLAEGTWEEVTRWFSAKPGIFTLPHPEQQLLFEYADRLRRAIRHVVGDHSWDRMYFDATTVTFERAPLPLDERRAPIYVDTRKLFGIPNPAPRDAAAPDVAVVIQVLRTAPAALELDDDARPLRPGQPPTAVQLQGWLLEQHVQHLEQLSHAACDGFLFVVYSNEARRRSAVDLREVASWASWHQPSETLWWATRHFRARTLP
ncbi:MAG: hypothetical protein IT375_07960 [Polyangiaceae bacterium]|nr:hypothetical protein [Polyangiaceae bacterium]MCK6534652.1 hypothetical protein [Polyangiaceae bacterium]